VTNFDLSSMGTCVHDLSRCVGEQARGQERRADKKKDIIHPSLFAPLQPPPPPLQTPSFAWNNAVVFANGKGPQICMDLHGLFPYATLWSNINVGNGVRAFLSGGDPYWGMNSGALTSYWNIVANG
jgi:hypothetical protein